MRARRPVVIPDEDRKTLEEVARDHVAVVLQACRYNRTVTARVLGIDRKTLAEYIRRWSIAVPTDPAPQRLQPGSLVVVEGLDGSGISTQARRLVDYLTEHDHPAVLTAEPSSGPVGQVLRRLLQSPTNLPYADPMRTLSLLFAADRLDHFHRIVEPAMAAGTTVVSERWYHSSLAYQRSSIDRDWILAVHRHTRAPDVTIYLDVPPELGLARRTAAGRRREFFHDAETQRAAADGYRATIAELRADGERVDVVDGQQPIEQVAATILLALGLGKRAAPAATTRSDP
nr:dTMP kinase [Kofleriaceae bacterium]